MPVTAIATIHIPLDLGPDLIPPVKHASCFKVRWDRLTVWTRGRVLLCRLEVREYIPSQRYSGQPAVQLKCGSPVGARAKTKTVREREPRCDHLWLSYWGGKKEFLKNKNLEQRVVIRGLAISVDKTGV